MGTNNITAEQVRELLSYDPETGRFVWRASGRAAGSLSHRGYLKIGINGRKLYAHRLAWLYTHGCWPEYYIDHINGDHSDNRTCNLRDATQSENLANAKGWRTNVCGHRGVHRHSDGRWRAQIKVGRRRIHIGLYATPTEAGSAYRRAASQHFGEFAHHSFCGSA